MFVHLHLIKTSPTHQHPDTLIKVEEHAETCQVKKKLKVWDKNNKYYNTKLLANQSRLYDNHCRAHQTKRLEASFKIQQQKYFSAVLYTMSGLRDEGLNLFVLQKQISATTQNLTISVQLVLILVHAALQKAGERIKFVTCRHLILHSCTCE